MLVGASPPSPVLQTHLINEDGSLGSAVEPTQVVMPEIPTIAWKARVHGILTFEARLDQAGRVTNVRTVKGLPMGVDDAARDAVAAWRFPTGGPGRTVRIEFEIRTTTAPSERERASIDGLRYWLGRLEASGDNFERTMWCREFEELDISSRAIAANQAGSLDLFREYMFSPHAAVALVASARVSELQGLDPGTVLFQMLDSDYRCGRCVAGQAIRKALEGRTRPASTDERRELAALVRETHHRSIGHLEIAGDFAYGRLGHSDMISGEATFHFRDGAWRLACAL